MGQYEQHVFVCTSGETCPEQGDTEKFVKILRERAKQAGRTTDVRINKAGCFSQCGHGPMLVVYPEGTWYAAVTPDDAEEIIQRHVIGGQPVERLLYDPPETGPHKLPRDEHDRPIGRPAPWPAR